VAVRYVDQGIYGSCSFNGQTATSILTINSISSGRFGLGSIVVIAGTTYYCSAILGLNVNGTGTFTLNNVAGGSLMSLTQSAIAMTSTYGNPLTGVITTSTGTGLEWGVAQDGDGTLIGAATSAIGSIEFTSVPTTGAISVMGAVISTTGVIGAGSTTAAADVLANNINAATTAAVASPIIGSPQVRNVVYARGPSNGAPANTCQIMTRQGSAAHNSLTNIASTFNLSPTVVQFAGGAGGAWAYTFNGFPAMWPQAIASYGTWASVQPYVGAIGVGDVVNVRAGKVINISPSNLAVPNRIEAMGSQANPVIFVIDNSTLWADGSEPTLKFLFNPANGVSGHQFRADVQTAYFAILGNKYASGVYSLQFEVTSTVAAELVIQFGGPCLMQGFSHIATNAAGGNCIVANATSWATVSPHATIFKDFLIKHASPSRWMIDFTAGAQQRLVCVNGEFNNGAAASSNTGFVRFTGNSNYGLTFDSCKFTNFVVGSKLLSSLNGPLTKFLLRNQSWGNVTDRGPTLLGATPVSVIAEDRSVVAHSAYGQRDFMIDTSNGFVEWNSTRSFPYLSGLQLDGATGWSYHFIPTTLAANIDRTTPFELPRIGKINTLADGARTITIEFALEKNIVWTRNDVSIQVQYEDVNGDIITLDSWSHTGVALTTSVITWQGMAVDPADAVSKVLYTDTGNLYHLRYKLAVSTPSGKNMRNGTDVGLIFRIHASVSNATRGGFVDPDFAIA